MTFVNKITIEILLVLQFAFFSLMNARNFSNPLMPNAFTPTPSVLEHKNQYYSISGNYLKGSKNLSIHVSDDLQNWKLGSYVFDEKTWPPWGKTIFDPEIHYINDDTYIIYFSTLDSDYIGVVGAAYSRNILGPYHTFYYPVKNDTTRRGQTFNHHIFNDNGTLYMFWTNQTRIFATTMNEDGLSLEDNQVITLITKTQYWEISVFSPYVIRRNRYYYMFYSAGGPCNVQGPSSIGGARSSHPLGPYEKNENNPILTQFDLWTGLHASSVVLDIDHETYVLMYEAVVGGTRCEERLLCAQSLTWDSNDWPETSVRKND